MKSETRKIITDGIWRNNPIFRQVLGICSTLAVTNLVVNTVVMCVALVFTLSLSAATVSLLRKFTPRNIRMMVETLIIAFYVIVVDLVLKAYWPEMSTNLGPYVGLIITNCIVMGRCEACGNINPPGLPGWFVQRFWLLVCLANNRDHPRTFRYGYASWLSDAVLQRTLLGQVDNYGRAARGFLYTGGSDVGVQVH